MALSLIGHKLFKTLGPLWILGLVLWINLRARSVPSLVPLAVAGDLLLLLLVAAVTHPAMLIFLSAATSTKRAPNENLGRELLELHSLGAGHYSEDDVKAVSVVDETQFTLVFGAVLYSPTPPHDWSS